MSLTIGIALTVPEPWASQLQQFRRQFGDPHADQMPTHITIVPPNSVQLLDLPAIHDGLRQAARTIQPFTLTLSGTDSFRPVSGVVFVDVVEGAQACTSLEMQVRERITARPRMHPYRPHVTAAMDVPEDVLDHAQLMLAKYHATWLVEEVTLFQRDRLGYWHPDRSFVLG